MGPSPSPIISTQCLDVSRIDNSPHFATTVMKSFLQITHVLCRRYFAHIEPAPHDEKALQKTSFIASFCGRSNGVRHKASSHQTWVRFGQSVSTSLENLSNIKHVSLVKFGILTILVLTYHLPFHRQQSTVHFFEILSAPRVKS